MIEEGASTRRLEVSGWKTKECSIGKQLARRNIELEEIREIGRGLAVQWFKGKKKRRNCTVCGIRQESSEEHEGSGIKLCGQTLQND